MPGHVKQALAEFEFLASDTPCCAPSKCNTPAHGKSIQCAHADDTEPLDKPKIQCMQRVIGKLLHHARAVDPTMMHAINHIASTATKGTEATSAATTCLLNCANTHPDTEIIHRAGDMILQVDSAT